jgi:hypothetical protein
MRQGNWLVCKPTKLDADLAAYESEDEDDDEERSSPRRRRRFTQYDPQGRQRSVTEEDTAKRMRDHQANMERIYQDRDYQLTQAWRNPR